MALIKCPECGKEISDKATNCPGCGYPVLLRKKNLIPEFTEIKIQGKNELSTARMVIGIVMLVFSTLVIFQSCSAGLYNITTNSKNSDGIIGVLFAFFMIITGIVGIVTRNTKKWHVPYFIGLAMCLVGFSTSWYNGIFRDLKIYGWVIMILGLVYTCAGGHIRYNKNNGIYKKSEM